MVQSTRLSSRLRRAPTRYRPVSRLAAGGMAEVWKAEAIFEGGETVQVAIKRVLPNLADNQLYRSMFEDEARLGMLLRHPNVVRVYDAREVGGTFLMVMELVDGTSLKDLLDRAHLRKACMPVATGLHVARELAKALDYAHRATDKHGRPLGIIHRDVSPHNLLLGKDGEVKLADFGLADATVHETVHGGDMVGGKLGYLAPEIIQQKPTDHRIDIFGAGVVLWESLAGRRLFQGETDEETVRRVLHHEVQPVSAFNPQVPPAVDAFVARLLERDPDRRTLSAHQMLEHADALIASVDPRVGTRDVSLLVGLHLAHIPAPIVAPKKTVVSTFDMLAQELDAFVDQAAGSAYELGAAPLDPDAFGSGPVGGPLSGGPLGKAGSHTPPSGVRPLPIDGPTDGSVAADDDMATFRIEDMDTSLDDDWFT